MSHPEGQAGTTDFVFTASLSNPSSSPVSADYSLQAGTATEGSDYDGAGGTVTFDPGQTTAEIVVPVHGDTTFEPDEDLTVTLSNATGGSIDTDSAVGTIQNDDSPPTIDIGESPSRRATRAWPTACSRSRCRIRAPTPSASTTGPMTAPPPLRDWTTRR